MTDAVDVRLAEVQARLDAATDDEDAWSELQVHAESDIEFLLGVVQRQQEQIDSLREVAEQLDRHNHTLIADTRARNRLLIETLTTDEHERVTIAGLPFCSCGLNLQPLGRPGQALDVWIEHALAVLSGSEEGHR